MLRVPGDTFGRYMSSISATHNMHTHASTGAAAAAANTTSSTAPSSEKCSAAARLLVASTAASAAAAAGVATLLHASSPATATIWRARTQLCPPPTYIPG